jgi:hypothetical protein
MKLNSTKQKELFLKDGYFVCENIFDINFVQKILEDIDKAKNTVKYFDNKNNLRRIEKLFDKGEFLKDLNNKILSVLKEIFDEDFIIFKDKFNAKPPGGEGFFAHFDGVFNFIDENNKKKMGGMNMVIFLSMFLLHLMSVTSKMEQLSYQISITVIFKNY